MPRLSREGEVVRNRGAEFAHARAPLTQVTMEDYPEAGMSALKYYTIQSYTK